MQMSHISPNPVTVTSILSACAQLGALSLGQWVHGLIRNNNFESNIYVSTALIDMYAKCGSIVEARLLFDSIPNKRAGKLEEALEFIKGIPENPSPPIWSTLLGACMIHKDMNMARLASEKLFELDPENMGYYVLMSNIYSSERKLVKTPGCTLVEIHQKPHVFKAGDWSHPQSTAIHAELEKLNTKMKEAGYQADTITALHDVEEEEKELMVKVHSEKLAIAFGLISTEPGTEIRIFKNLRICQDCHTASKYISKITHRVIVARDANRFHHFKDGSCSCGDYW
ncbi:Pentatricopeptide repeat-containing protein At4g30700 [Linum grandiflorum]